MSQSAQNMRDPTYGTTAVSNCPVIEFPPNSLPTCPVITLKMF